MKPPESQIDLGTYALVYTIGFMSQLFRLLMDPTRKHYQWVALLAGSAAAGLAALIASNLFVFLFGGRVELVIAVSGIFGWLGGNAIEGLARTFEEKTGIKTGLTRPLVPVPPVDPAPDPAKEGA